MKEVSRHFFFEDWKKDKSTRKSPASSIKDWLIRGLLRIQPSRNIPLFHAGPDPEAVCKDLRGGCCANLGTDRFELRWRHRTEVAS